ncbi:cation diffusion facilitator family transporter [Mucilaginibacter segetis]|uniref:Cation diffusion facilitator family transporter n=1 Tax=Mucilaginibacter segetis TaxID=2793071 RepID=A0A934PS86_9SPHI|nr:cation diffusion facilitator family transporter [Mucilaginibacter segetis]MBK0378095.1 cation diffusion facilitator family transporter [Mucilaginibacter segetis]
MPASKTPLYTAFLANIVIAGTKLTAAFITGSSAMASEGIHSLVDTSNEVLLLLGMKKSKKPADVKHPFGYGRELYFWAFIVSLLFFALGGGMSIYEGVLHIMHPEEIKSPVWNYAVLGIAFVFDGLSLLTALKEFNRQRGDTPFWEAVRKSKDPSTFVVLFEDAADVIGILIAFTGIFLSALLQNPYIDGVASILIGILLTIVALFLVRESRSLLMGETAPMEEIASILAILKTDENVIDVASERSMYLSPEEVILFLNIKFDPELQSRDLANVINSIHANIQIQYSHYKHIYIEPVQ